MSNMETLTKQLSVRVEDEVFASFHRKTFRIGGRGLVLRALIKAFNEGELEVDFTEEGEAYVRTPIRRIDQNN